MLELGELSDHEHRVVGEIAKIHDIRVIAVGAPEYGGENVATIDQAIAVLGDLGEGDAVLVKASRAAGLELLAARLLGEDAAW
jgi:UDP-N-acetylmuramoyl-tripeptide--D-alanyl-D-alanine ligase